MASRRLRIFIAMLRQCESTGRFLGNYNPSIEICSSNPVITVLGHLGSMASWVLQLGTCGAAVRAQAFTSKDQMSEQGPQSRWPVRGGNKDCKSTCKNVTGFG